jgi:hypothetical protein
VSDESSAAPILPDAAWTPPGRPPRSLRHPEGLSDLAVCSYRPGLGRYGYIDWSGRWSGRVGCSYRPSLGRYRHIGREMPGTAAPHQGLVRFGRVFVLTHPGSVPTHRPREMPATAAPHQVGAAAAGCARWRRGLRHRHIEGPLGLTHPGLVRFGRVFVPTRPGSVRTHRLVRPRVRSGVRSGSPWSRYRHIGREMPGTAAPHLGLVRFSRVFVPTRPGSVRIHRLVRPRVRPRVRPLVRSGRGVRTDPPWVGTDTSAERRRGPPHHTRRARRPPGGGNQKPILPVPALARTEARTCAVGSVG